MAIKSGELIHVADQVLLDRAQTAGPGSLNIPETKVYELGNYLAVATVYDTPDLKFSLDSLDCSAQLEALLTNTDYSAMSDGDEIDMGTIVPLDVASQFKKGRTSDAPFEVEGSVSMPFLTAESVSYDFGLKANAKQTVSLAGDCAYFSTGSTYIQEATGSNTANQAVILAHLAIPFNGDTAFGVRYALSVSLTVSGIRLVPGLDYTETPTGAGFSKQVTVTVLAAVPVTEKIRISYHSTVKASYPQASHALADAVKPAALRGRDIEIRIGGVTITDRWSSVQSFQTTWSVQLEKDEEFGNYNLVSQGFDVPDVKGSVTIKPRDVGELMTRIHQIAGESTAAVVGANQNVTLPLEVLLHAPEDGSVLKTLYVDDARFVIPSFQGQVQQKLSVKFDYSSDSGSLLVYKGEKP